MDTPLPESVFIKVEPGYQEETVYEMPCTNLEVGLPDIKKEPLLNSENTPTASSTNVKTVAIKAKGCSKEIGGGNTYTEIELDLPQDKMRQKFYDTLSKKVLKENSAQISTAKYNQLREEVNAAKRRSKKLNRDYWLLRHYDVIKVGGKEKLIAPAVNKQILFYIPFEQVFNVLYNAHESTRHGGRDRMRKELQQRYKNITLREIQVFLNLCDICSQKKKTERKVIVVKPKVFSELDSRCQVDLLDYQTQPDGDFKYIMLYQDDLTKFIILKPLKSNTAAEVADNILDIFLLFGAPSVLQSDNGREFCINIIENLKILWPELKIVHGNPKHIQAQGSVERTNEVVENLLTAWMMSNKCTNWSKGLRFVQFMKNLALQAEIKQSPYEALFRRPAKVGLTTSKLHCDIIEDIYGEESLEAILDSEEITDNVLIEADVGLNTDNDVEEILFEEVSVSDFYVKKNKCGTCEIELQSHEENICTNCTHNIFINRAGQEAKEIQAKRIKLNSDASYPAAEKGTTVRAKVPGEDRRRKDIGVAKGLYCGSQFTVGLENIMTDILPEEEFSIRTIAKKQSLASGQGFSKCYCKNGCINDRCSCKKKKVSCNSKCHSSMQCSN